MTDFQLTSPTEMELSVQSVVSAVQALERFSTKELQDEYDNLLHAAEWLEIFIDEIRLRRGLDRHP